MHTCIHRTFHYIGLEKGLWGERDLGLSCFPCSNLRMFQKITAKWLPKLYVYNKVGNYTIVENIDDGIGTYSF